MSSGLCVSTRSLGLPCAVHALVRVLSSACVALDFKWRMRLLTHRVCVHSVAEFARCCSLPSPHLRVSFVLHQFVLCVVQACRGFYAFRCVCCFLASCVRLYVRRLPLRFPGGVASPSGLFHSKLHFPSSPCYCIPRTSPTHTHMNAHCAQWMESDPLRLPAAFVCECVNSKSSV